jgi:hypothetical protein
VRYGRPSGEGFDRGREYIPTMSMRNLFVALAITAIFLGILVVAGTAQNQGCLPWKEAVHVGGSAFSEGDRGHTVCR